MFCKKCEVELKFRKGLAENGRIYFECPQCHSRIWRKEPVQAQELALIIIEMEKRLTAAEQYYFEGS